jgi:hypothetical protein
LPTLVASAETKKARPARKRLSQSSHRVTAAEADSSELWLSSVHE